MADENEKMGGPRATGDKPSGNAAGSREKSEQNARRDALGTGLRRAYQEVLSEPIPDEFSSLLDKLSDAEDDSERK